MKVLKMGFSSPPMPKYHWISDMIQKHFFGTPECERIVRWESVCRGFFFSCLRSAAFDKGIILDDAQYVTEEEAKIREIPKTLVLEDKEWVLPTSSQASLVAEIYEDGMDGFSEVEDFLEGLFFACLGIPLPFSGSHTATLIETLFGVETEKNQKKRHSAIGQRDLVFQIKSHSQVKGFCLERISKHSDNAFLFRSPFPFGTSPSDLTSPILFNENTSMSEKEALSWVMLAVLSRMRRHTPGGVGIAYPSLSVQPDFEIALVLQKYIKHLPLMLLEWTKKIPT